MIIFEYISISSILIAVIIGALVWKTSSIQFKALINLVWCGGVVELWSLYVQPNLVNSKYSSNVVWYLFEFVLIVMFYHFMIKNKAFIQLSALWVSIYLVFSYLTSALDTYNPSVRLMMSTPLVLISTWGLYQSVKNKDLAVGIVSLGFLLYFCSTIPVFLYYNDLNRSIWVLHSAFNILMNLLIGLGFHVHTRTIRTDLKDIRDRRSVSVDRSDLAGL